MKKILTFICSAALLAACSDDKDDYVFDVDWPQSDFIEFGTSTSYEVIQSGFQRIETDAPKGWTVSVSSGKVTVTAPSQTDGTAETYGKLTISSDESGYVFSKSMTVNTGIVVGFEDVPEGVLAVDKKGSNFYSIYGPDQYTGYTDAGSGLGFSLNEALHWSGNGAYTREFYNGGTVFSTWNSDFETTDDNNQCTVNYVDPQTGKGGRNGSEVFAIVFYDAFNGVPTTVEFPEGEERVLDHFWIMNTFYVSYVMENGNSFAQSLADTGGELYVTVTGYNGAGSRTGSVDFHLADFRTTDSPGIIDQWTRVDLSPLGSVNRIEFSFDGSDNGGYGLNTPAYFCFDDLAIRY